MNLRSGNMTLAEFSAWTNARGRTCGSSSLAHAAPIQRTAVVVLLVLVSGLVNAGWADSSQEPLKQLSLAQLGNVEVTTASKEPEEVWKTPAAVFVITQEDIRRSGATNLPEALRLASGHR